MRRVRLMRDSILKRRTRIDEVQVKGPSRELARLQSDKERADSQNKAWLDNLEDNDNICKNICLFCGRQFDRRAVLLSHHKVIARPWRWPFNTFVKCVYGEYLNQLFTFYSVGLPTKEETQHANFAYKESGPRSARFEWLE